MEPVAATKLTVIVGGDERHAHQPLYEVVLQVFREAGVSGATLTKGMMSYGIRRRVHSNLDEVTMENLPVIIEAVDEDEKIRAAAERVAEVLGAHGLVQLQPTSAMRLAPPGGERMGD